jgi:hypothetical protein
MGQLGGRTGAHGRVLVAQVGNQSRQYLSVERLTCLFDRHEGLARHLSKMRPAIALGEGAEGRPGLRGNMAKRSQGDGSLRLQCRPWQVEVPNQDRHGPRGRIAADPTQHLCRVHADGVIVVVEARQQRHNDLLRRQGDRPVYLPASSRSGR